MTRFNVNPPTVNKNINPRAHNKTEEKRKKEVKCLVKCAPCND